MKMNHMSSLPVVISFISVAIFLDLMGRFIPVCFRLGADHDVVGPKISDLSKSRQLLKSHFNAFFSQASLFP